MTTDRPVSIQEPSMRFGTYMGIFWMFKFIFLPLGFSIPLLQLFFILCTLFVPILGYLYARKFRNTYCEGTISFSRAFLFTMYRQQLNEAKAMVQGELATSIDQIMIAFDTVAALTPIQLTFQLITQNVFYGILLSLPTGLLVMRYKK